MGQKNTKVANAYSEAIWVKVEADQLYVKAVDLSAGFKEVKVGGKIDLDWDKVKKNGYTRVGPGLALEFDVNFATGKNVAYITIFSEESKLLICDSFPRRGGRHVAVDPKGFLRTVKDLDDFIDDMGEVEWPVCGEFENGCGTYRISKEKKIKDIHKLKYGPAEDDDDGSGSCSCHIL